MHIIVKKELETTRGSQEKLEIYWNENWAKGYEEQIE